MIFTSKLATPPFKFNVEVNSSEIHHIHQYSTSTSNNVTVHISKRKQYFMSLHFECKNYTNIIIKDCNILWYHSYYPKLYCINKRIYSLLPLVAIVKCVSDIKLQIQMTYYCRNRIFGSLAIGWPNVDFFIA